MKSTKSRPRALVVALSVLASAIAHPAARAQAPTQPQTSAEPQGEWVEYSFKESGPADEALVFTPAGFDKVGVPARADGPFGRLRILVRDGDTAQPTPCRVNVVGSDGNYYEPKANRLTLYSLTGEWPNWPRGWGNRPGKAPIRYLGRYFYSTGDATVDVPPGPVRIEVWKGFEYRPQTFSTRIHAGETRDVELTLPHSVSMRQRGYYSGDPHVHIPRGSEEDEQTIFDLLEAENIHFSTLLAYNEPAGPYAGLMDKMDSPQFRGLGKRSIQTRDDYHILSGQEYRSGTYGHLNLFLLDQLVLTGQSLNANNWPLYGDVARAARGSGGVAWYAHGGYAQAIYADVVQNNIDAVELLQFGVYRGIGLNDWYRILNCGFRFPATGASDYPACRKLGDCQTYVYSAEPPDFAAWLQGAAAGRSFVTSGPLLLLEVNDEKPGASIQLSGDGPHRVRARIRVTSEVAPLSRVQLVANGRVLEQLEVPADRGQGKWIELEREITLPGSAWIAARAFSLSRLGTPDAESHTNPVYVYVNNRAPYEQAALDVLVQRIDQQIAAHKQRQFAEQARVLAYFERSRDILLKIREAGGAPATGHPSDLFARQLPALADPGARVHSEEELRAFLKPVPPKPIKEVLRSFETVGGFQMELVAQEPLVFDPVAAAFDEEGNLYVAEMRDYPYKPQEGQQPIGRVRLLRDTDGDGRFDEGHVFADHLLWAAGVAPWQGGVYVAAPPDIWYCKDTDGDHVADVRQRVFTGFGTENQQAMLNNLTFGLDHKIYGSTAGNGGTIHRAQDGAQPVSVDGRDFRFDPRTHQFEAITGTVQFGNSFDDWGNRFLCSESQPLLHDVLPQHYLARNPYLPVPRAVQNIAPGPVPIFRISPIERWRQIRSSRRIAHNARLATAAGASHHVIDAAAGVTVYRGGAYPPEFYGNVFVGEAQNNVIHRRRLLSDGVTFQSARVDEGTEVVRSSDNWFRPVNFVNAPDGTLYVLDMSREILETIHIPLDVVKHLDLTSGRDHGRIYRLAPPDFRYPGPPRLSKAATSELVAALESPHGWWRDTAHRLIYERQDVSAAEPLRRLLRASRLPQTRLHALWSLEGLKRLDEQDLVVALADASPHVRAHAVRLAEPLLDESPMLLARVLALAADSAVPIRCQVAFSLGETHDERAPRTLAAIARLSPDDVWIRTAVLSSATAFADRLLIELASDPKFVSTSGAGGWLDQLALVVGARGANDQLDRVLAFLAQRRDAGYDALSQQLVLSMAGGLRRSGKRLITDRRAPAAARDFLRLLLEDATKIAPDPSASPGERERAVRILACAEFERSGTALSSLLNVQQPEQVQVAVIQALSGYSTPQIGSLLLRGWREYSPAVRKAAINSLLARQDLTRQFLQAAVEGNASVAEIDPSARSLLVEHRDPEIRKLAAQLFSSISKARGDLVTDYRSALELSADLKRGEAVFRRECMACHRLGNVGYAIGPDLASSSNRDAQALLVHVLDPNQHVLPQYTQYVAVDTSGRSYSGIIAAQTATSVTLRREEEKGETLLRTNIEQLASTGKSLMPEGLEKNITKQDMADLIAFLQASQAADDEEPPLDIGTLPGLVEPAK